MTYEEVRDALGLPSTKAALQRSRRGNWPRRLNNADKLARVGVPASVLAAPRNPSRDASRSLLPSAGDPMREAAGGVTGGIPGGDGSELATELRRRAEAAESRAERAEDERDKLAVEVIKERERGARGEGELAGLQIAIQQAEGRAQRAEAEAKALRDAEARAAAQATAERAERQAAETARDAARTELAELTAGGPLRRALRAFVFRRGRS